MEAINNNYSQFAANFATKLEQISESAAAKATGAVDLKQEVSSASQVRVAESKNQVSYVQSHPEIAESANLTADERTELLQSTSDKIVSGEIKCRGNRVMFDIYSVLALIQETAQEMRNAQRDLRKAEVAAITSSILAQADMQRTAALTQLIAGSITAGISIAMTVVSVSKMANEAKSAIKAQNAAGMEPMQQQQNLTLAEGNKEVTAHNLKQQQGTVPQSVQQKVNADMETAGANQKISSPEVSKLEGEVASAKKDVATAQQEVSTAEKNLQEAEKGTAGELAAKEQVNNATKNLETANTKLSAKEAELAAAKDGGSGLQTACNERAEKLEGVVDKYQAEFNVVSEKASTEYSLNGKVSDDTASELKTAGQKLNYARAYQLDQCAKMPLKPQTGTPAFMKVNNSVMRLKSNAVPLSNGSKAFTAQMIGQSVMAVNSLGAAVGQGVAGIYQAIGTSYQAKQRQAEEQLDQIKDLFNNTQQVIQQAIQLFQSVTSKESQSIEEIIGGIKA